MIKRILLLFGILSLLQIQNSYSQKPNLGEWEAAKWLKEEKIDTLDINSVRSAFNSESPYTSKNAAIYLALKGYTDIIPAIKQKYDNLVEWDKYSYGDGYLVALYLLEDSQVHQMTLAFLDSSIVKHKHGIYTSPLDISTIMDLLSRMEDYNHFNLLDSILTVAPEAVTWELLDVYIDKGYKAQIFNRIKTFVHHPKEKVKKMLVWQLLSYKEYPETQNIYREIAQRDSGSVRYRALKILCEEYKDPIVLDISAQMLLTHNDWSSIVEAIWIFEDFGSPYALAKLTEVEKQMPAGVFITGLNPTFPQFETKKHITEEIKDYKPPIIEGSVLLALDSLKNYTYQCSQLQWIDNLSFVNSITNYLITAKTKLQAGDSVGCYQSVKQFQNGVNAEYRDTLNTTPNFVTIEGWKFLYYNSQYILERLPKPPPPSLVAALKNSNGAKLTDGTLQYYDASWKDAVNNNDGTFNITTTKTSLSLRMTYAYGSQQKNNVPVNSDTVIFQTINSQVQLKNSNGTLLDTGTVQYYAGAWRTFGTTTNGITTKELLPNNYSFRMTYAFASNDKSQDLNTNSIVLFQTVNASVQLKNSQGDLMDQGTVQYYSGAWRTFGTTTNGVAAKELLPNNYSFRMSYAFASKDTQQNLNTNPIVTFKTVNAQVQLKNSNGTFLDTGTVQYYAGAWRTFGTTTNGIIKKELLPNSYQFRLTYGFVSSDKTQNVGSDNIVNFSTVQTTVRVKNLQNNPVNNASVTYYSGAWRNFGTTANGEAVKELLPINLQFRAKLGTAQADKTQNLSTNRLVEIQLNVAQ